MHTHHERMLSDSKRLGMRQGMVALCAWNRLPMKLTPLDNKRLGVE